MTMTVRYIVEETAPAIEFYAQLGFVVVMNPTPGFAMLQREGLRLLLSTPGGGGGAGQPMPDGTEPEPGGWNRFVLEVDDLDATVDRLCAEGAEFRSGIISGNGGRQAIVVDPSANPVELLEPADR